MKPLTGNFLIGTDEAGYGPNLGPLVVGATLWRLPDDVEVEEDIETNFEAVDLRTEFEACTEDMPHIKIADSKSVYGRDEASARNLINCCLTLLASAGKSNPSDASEFVAALTSSRDVPDERTQFPFWNIDSNSPNSNVWETAIRQFANATSQEPAVGSPISQGKEISSRLAKRGIELVDIKTTTIFPQEFNRRRTVDGNKAFVLSKATFELIARTVADANLSPKNLFIECDKHGGRSKYLPLMYEHWSSLGCTGIVETSVESLHRSRYRWASRTQSTDAPNCLAEFVAKGESRLPVAAASLFAKAVREVFMRAWNQFWRRHVPEIRPTAGYPVDAKRFVKEIATDSSRLGFTPADFWRDV